MKICYIASSGGHLEQVIRLNQMLGEYHEGFIVTEKTNFSSGINHSYNLYQVNRRELLFFPKMIANTIRSVRILVIEKPDVIISTGALAVIPLCLVAKLSGKKLIFVESFAVINKPTLTGKLLYRFADRFYVQWEPLKKVYPRSIYLGGIY